LVEELRGLDSEPSEHRARRVLLLLLEVEPVACSPVPVRPELCPNCSAPCDSRTSPYCGDRCREESAFVRQMRRSLADGALADGERQLAMGQKLWHLLGGGYPHRQTLAPPSALKQLTKRTGGLCEACSNPASTFDHLGSG
jgi:hypothetical protein